MTPHDQYVFVQGVLYGAALQACRQQHEFAEFDQRLQKVERGFVPVMRFLRRLVPVTDRRDGHRVYRLG